LETTTKFVDEPVKGGIDWNPVAPLYILIMSQCFTRLEQVWWPTAIIEQHNQFTCQMFELTRYMVNKTTSSNYYPPPLLVQRSTAAGKLWSGL
jgi:hypothetical protein